MTWTADTELKRVDDTTFTASIGEHWASLQGAHGGVVAALAVRAADEALKARGVEAGTTLRAATFGYASGNAVGDLQLTVDVVRQGRQMSTVHVTASQGDKRTTVARLHYSTPWESIEFSDAPAAPVRPTDTYQIDSSRIKHFQNVDANVDSRTVSFKEADRGEWRAWSRPKEGNTFDAAWLTMVGDYLPPAVFTRLDNFSRAVTIEYSIQIHSGAGTWTLASDEYIAMHMHVFHSSDGFAVEDGWIWLPNGELLATVRQTRLAG